MTEDKEIVEFDIKMMLPIGMSIIIVGIGVAVGLDITADVRDDTCPSGYTYVAANGSCCVGDGTSCDSAANFSDPAEFNATEDAITGVGKIPAKLGIIVTAMVAAILIGILTRYLMVKY